MLKDKNGNEIKQGDWVKTFVMDLKETKTVFVDDASNGTITYQVIADNKIEDKWAYPSECELVKRALA